jgi:hypothetical protein
MKVCASVLAIGYRTQARCHLFLRNIGNAFVFGFAEVGQGGLAMGNFFAGLEDSLGA